MIIIILSAILGILMGVLINYILYRVYGNIKGDFKCPHCRHKLKPSEIIPIISFFISKGKCSYCNKSIPLKYPVIEIVTGVVFTCIAYILNFNLFGSGTIQIEFFQLIFYWFIASYLIMVLVSDTKWHVVPEKLTSVGIFLGVIILGVGTFLLNIYTIEELSLRLITAFSIFLIFFIVYLVTNKKAISFSDVKLVTFIGLTLGFPLIIPSVIFTFLLGTIFGIILVLLKKETIKSKIPFSPFLILGAILAYTYGNFLIDVYLGLL